MRRVLIVLGVAIAAAFVACRAFWPERLAVNAPVIVLLMGAKPPPKSELESRLKVPDGFSVGLFAEGIPDARELHFSPTGDLLVSSPREGAVFLLEPDADGDGRADGSRALMTGLESPQGLEIIGDWLYVAENGAVKRVRFDPRARATEGSIETVLPDLPPGGNHWGKYIRRGPDGWIYLTIGSDCNVCIEVDPRRATIGRFKDGASDYEIYATGLRNSVGFDWRPADGAMYATDNGRDLLGDDFPPCELNRIEPGRFYGWPFVNGMGVPDPDFGAKGGAKTAEATSPAHGFGAHTAPLGMRFYRGNAFPARYRGQAFVALHGSWNRTAKSGYKVVLLEWSADGREIVESDFLTGFELDENVIGRPVDVQDGPDGALYVSDDFAGAVYRVVYTGAGRAQSR
ncbi:MAG: sorbosone dehydrogenase family protein [Deltaproteobacteria bacterium]|nr:sorbosone dehydrogenase family protein [Deltaproteobacteria bacterium]